MFGSDFARVSDSDFDADSGAAATNRAGAPARTRPIDRAGGRHALASLTSKKGRRNGRGDEGGKEAEEEEQVVVASVGDSGTVLVVVLVAGGVRGALNAGRVRAGRAGAATRTRCRSPGCRPAGRPISTPAGKTPPKKCTH